MNAQRDPLEWGDPLLVPSDEADGRQLQVMHGGNGDWYIGVVQPGNRFALDCVRLSTSGGVSSRVPGVTAAAAALYRALWDHAQAGGK